MPQIRLPNLIIAGVVKAGTTSLYTYLARHPDICASTVKETCYFLQYRYGQLDCRYQEGINPDQQYQSYFKQCEDQKYVMEATPAYFDGGEKVAQEIKKQLGEKVKIIIVLREPIDRLISFFKYKKSILALKKELTLEEYIQQCQDLPLLEKSKPENDTYWGIEGGFYANYLSDWFKVFGDSVKVLFFDDFKQNLTSFLQDIYDWLSVDINAGKPEIFSIENRSVGYKSQTLQQIALLINGKLEEFWRTYPNLKKALRTAYHKVNGVSFSEEMKVETLHYLQDIYQPYNEKLAKQLKEQGFNQLPQWLGSSKK